MLITMLTGVMIGIFVASNVKHSGEYESLQEKVTEVLDLLTALNAAGQSILMVTHDARAALRASRIIYISDGKAVGELSLAPYTAESEKHREAQVSAWLTAMEW